MKTWCDVKLEDIQQEIAPGVMEVDPDVVRKLNWGTWLKKIEDLVEMGYNQDEAVAKDLMEEALSDAMIDACHVLRQKGPEPEEIRRYQHELDSILTKQSLTWLCTHVTKEDWPETKERLIQELDLLR